MKLRGPHSPNELALMLAGEKPCAFMTPDYCGEFDQAVRNGLIVDAGIVVVFCGLFDRIFTLPGEEWRADWIRAVYEECVRRDRMTPNDDRVLGRALGYPEEAIEWFVDNVRRK